MNGHRRWSLAAAGTGIVAVLLAAGTSALGESAASPGLGAATFHPPWDLGLHPSSVLVTAVLAAALALATVSVVCGLVAVARGARPRPAAVAIAALAAVALLVVVPPLGSADHLSYVAYGRIAAAGNDPYVQDPLAWRGGTDPVAGAIQPPWQHAPSVYGPVATLAQAAVAATGGGSLRLTVWLWQLLCGAAFLGAALALDRITRADPAARARGAVLWTLNPLVLQQLVLGAHVDVIAAALAAAALATMIRTPLIAGMLLGAAAGTKVPYAVFAVAIAWGLRRLPRPRALRAAALAIAGAGLVLVPAHVWSGPHTYDQLRENSRFISFATPWRLLADQLDPVFGRQPVRTFAQYAAVACALGLALLLSRRVPRLPAVGDPVTADAARAALLLCAAWILTTPYALPWYDPMAWVPLVLVAPSPLDGALLARLAALALAYVPGRTVGLSPGVERLTLGFRRDVAPWLTLAVVIAVVLWTSGLWRWRPGAESRRPAPEPAHLPR